MKKGWSVTYVDLTDQRRGIDRVIERTDERMTVEYKVEYKAKKTGNVYIETVSVNSPFKQGWAWTCQADRILYTVIGDDSYVLWVRPKEIKKCIPYWTVHYRTVKCINRDYWGEGILVPID